MKKYAVLLLILLMWACKPAPNELHQIITPDNENGAVVFRSDTNTHHFSAGTAYPRIICLKHNGEENGTLLCTFEYYVYHDSMTVFPIHRSTDHGATWELVTYVEDTHYREGNRFQPDLFELPEEVEDLPEGTILLSGNVIPFDGSSTRMVLYISKDAGETWEYRSTIDGEGGPARYSPRPDAQTTAIWEPFFNLDEYGNLVCYYSDERQKADGILQCLVHKVSGDGGLTWGPMVNDVAIPDTLLRPGMIVVSALPDGRYFASYEMVNLPGVPVYYKYSEDGVDWGDPADYGYRVMLEDSTTIRSTPYSRWIDAGGPNGIIIVAGIGIIGGGSQNYFVNYDLGEGPWERLPAPVTFGRGRMAGYSQSFDSDPDNTVLYQATPVSNPETRLNDIVVGVRPLVYTAFEAEDAASANGRVEDFIDAVGGKELVLGPEGSVTFENIQIEGKQEKKIRLRYRHPGTSDLELQIQLDDGELVATGLMPTGGELYKWKTLDLLLGGGDHSLMLSTTQDTLKIDQIEVY